MNERPDQRVGDGSGTGHEIEIKFRTDPEGLKRVLNSPAFTLPAVVHDQILRSNYFDTSLGDLRKQNIALRIRKRGRGGPILGVKAKCSTSEGPFSRIEIEVRSRSLQPELSLFDAETAAELGRLIGERPLELQFETKVRRRAVLVERGRSHIELTCDDGKIVSGDQTAPLAEVELELKSGDESDLCDFAITLVDQFPLKLDFTSKAERGFCLSTGESLPTVRATAIEYGVDATLDDAVVAVVSNALAHFIGNWAALRTADRADAVHQARVALRRLRTAMKMFQHVLSCPEIDALRNEARRIASAFGSTRECDAFLGSVTKGPLAHPDRPTGFEVLLAAVGDRRAAAFRDVRALLEEVETTRFVLEVRGLLARRAWRNGLIGSQFVQLTSPAETFARDALDRLHARALKRGKNLAKLSNEARHKLRISLKNLRYGAEFFGGFFGGRRKFRRYVAIVSTLQDLLGAHNDVVSARRLLDDSPPEMGRTSGFILGWYAHQMSFADAKLIDAWKKFEEADVFWW